MNWSRRIAVTPVSSKYLLTGFVPVRDDVVIVDGVEQVRSVVERPRTVAMVATDDGRVALVSQYRHAVENLTYEVPAGRVDDGETDFEAAARELREECGLRPSMLTRLGRPLLMSPGYSNERITIFHCAGLTRDPLPQDHGEGVSMHWLGLDEVWAAIDGGRVADAKSIVALTRYMRLLGRHA